jgi:uncharacterized protein (DUF302 family)
MSQMSNVQTRISYKVESTEPVADVVERVTLELKKRGYGVLSQIDVKKMIKEKLGEDMSDYVILDICNPKHAKRAIETHKEVGLILPCKITVHEEFEAGKRRTAVSLYKPSEAIKVLSFDDLRPLAEDVEKDLIEAVDAVAA